jgi:hypothetical protein
MGIKKASLSLAKSGFILFFSPAFYLPKWQTRDVHAYVLFSISLVFRFPICYNHIAKSDIYKNAVFYDKV